MFNNDWRLDQKNLLLAARLQLQQTLKPLRQAVALSAQVAAVPLKARVQAPAWR